MKRVGQNGTAIFRWVEPTRTVPTSLKHYGPHPIPDNTSSYYVTVKEPDKTSTISMNIFCRWSLLPKQTSNKPRANAMAYCYVTPPTRGGRFVMPRVTLFYRVERKRYPYAGFAQNLPLDWTIGTNCPAFDPLHLQVQIPVKNVCPMVSTGKVRELCWFNHANVGSDEGFCHSPRKEMQTKGRIRLRYSLVYMNFLKENPNVKAEDILKGKLKNGPMNTDWRK